MLYKPILKKGIAKYDPKIDYCSMSPEGLLGCKYSKACYWHDRQYRDELQNRVSRLKADLYLWRDIITESWKVRKTSIIWSWRVGYVYFMATRLAGKRHYIN